MRAARVARGVIFCATISFRINSFGVNPVRGGRPPSDIRIGISRMIMGVVVHAIEESFRVFKDS